MTSPAQRNTRHVGIERDDVVETARQLVEAEGGDALTMRRLASELGVTTTTLYWHVGRREDIVLAVIERQAQLMAVRNIRGSNPHDRIVHAAMHVWETAQAHPRLTGLAHATGTSAVLQLPQEIALTRELVAAGITGSDARDALRSILSCVAGFLVLALRRNDLVPPDRSTDALWRQVDDAGIDAATRAAMSEAPDLEQLCRESVSALVQHWLAR